MLEQLLHQQLIDIEGLFLFSYKKLEINELQAMIVLLTLRLEKNKEHLITPKIISEYMSVDEKTIDKNIIILMNKQILALQSNSLSTQPLLNAIKKVSLDLDRETEIKEKSINLVKLFEKEFSRSLTPIEIETLKEWKQCQYSDQMILNALKEATLSNVHNMRYIERILIDWAKHGMKVSGRETVDTQEKVVNLVEYDWWNE